MHWLGEPNVWLGMQPIHDLIRSTVDMCMLFTLWLEYFTARTRRGDLLRLAVEPLNRGLNDAFYTRKHDRLASALDPEPYFKTFASQ